jgi:hypothetical protein
VINERRDDKEPRTETNNAKAQNCKVLHVSKPHFLIRRGHQSNTLATPLHSNTIRFNPLIYYPIQFKHRVLPQLVVIARAGLDGSKAGFAMADHYWAQ